MNTRITHFNTPVISAKPHSILMDELSALAFWSQLKSVPTIRHDEFGDTLIGVIPVIKK